MHFPVRETETQNYEFVYIYLFTLRHLKYDQVGNGQTFSIKGQLVNIFGVEGYMVSVIILNSCHERAK